MTRVQRSLGNPVRPLRHSLRAPRAAQRGVVLFIALIVLVAMTLAGVAIVRSVDTGNLVAGNIAFKQGTLSTADSGIDQAFKWLRDNTLTGALNGDVPSEGYFAVVSEPADWTDDAVWTDAKYAGVDSAGNEVWYMIHRMCLGTGKYSSTTCAQTPRKGKEAGNSVGFWGAPFEGTPVVFYRVTSRVIGPRDTMSIIQSNIALQH